MNALDPIYFATLLTAAMLGVMLFFAAVIAPSVFRALSAEAAGQFLRTLFPRYYDVLFLAALLASMLSWGQTASLVLFVVAVFFLVGRFWLMPRINRTRDLSLSGDASAKKQFGMLHSASVAINAAQIIALAVVVVLIR